MPAREEVIAFARAVHADGKGETVLLVAADDEAAAAARKAAPLAEVVVEPFGDLCQRETAPILVLDGTGSDYDFNGWGGKPDMPGDADLGQRRGARPGTATDGGGGLVEGWGTAGAGT